MLYVVCCWKKETGNCCSRVVCLRRCVHSYGGGYYYGGIYPFVDDIWLEKKFYVMKDCTCFLVEICRFCGSNSCGLCIFVIFSVFYI